MHSARRTSRPSSSSATPGQFGWKYGLSATWVGIGNAILGSLLAWWVLGPRTREMTQRLGAATMPEFFGRRYRSRALRIAAAAIIFVFLIPYTASVYNGLSRLFGMAFGLPYEACVIGMALITCIYVVLGGYMATVVNDFLQGIVMLFGITAVICAVLAGNGGFSQAVIDLSHVQAETNPDLQGAFVSMFGPDLLNLLGVVVLTSLGTWGLPQMVQKFYAIKSGPAIKQGAIISTIFAMVVAGGSYFLGGFGRLYSGQIEMSATGTPIYDSIIPTMLSTLPDLLVGLVIVLVLSASMSTLSSLVLTSSSTLTLDLLKDNVVKNMDEKRQLTWMRGLLVAFVAISAIIALVQYSSSITFIAQLMSHQLGRAGGRLPRSLPVGPVLQAHLEGRRVDELHRGRRLDQRKHDCGLLRPCAYRKPHQLRRARNAALARDCAAREPGYQAGRFRHGHRAAEPQERDRPRNRSRGARGGSGGNGAACVKGARKLPFNERWIRDACNTHETERRRRSHTMARRVSRTQGIP